jgi:hypothetical protein
MMRSLTAWLDRDVTQQGPGVYVSLEFAVNHASRLIEVVASGRLSVDELLAYPRQIVQHPDYDPSFHELFDARDVDASVLSMDVVRKWVAGADENPVDKKHRVAFVVDGKLAYGVVRQYQMMREDPDLPTSIFEDLDEARSWLDRP